MMDYFQLFHLTPTFQQDAATLQAKFYALQQTAHPDNFVSLPATAKQSATQLAALINDAYRTLKDPFKRALYLLKLRGIDVLSETTTQLPQDVLIEQIELREAFADAKSDPALLQNFAKNLQHTLTQLEAQISQWTDVSDIHLIKRKLWQMQFYRKLQEELL